MAKGESQVLKIARRRVNGYQRESEWMKSHREAMECLDCEAFLQLGIEAYQWLLRADQAIRRSVFEDAIEWPADLNGTLELLFRRWLDPCEFARQRISVQESRGYEVANKDEFLDCCEQVEAIVSSFDDRQLPNGMAVLQDEALAEYRNGETAEFV